MEKNNFKLLMQEKSLHFLCYLKLFFSSPKLELKSLDQAPEIPITGSTEIEGMMKKKRNLT